MTQFEYVSVAASLVFALVLARLCESLPSVFSRERRYWVHSLWVLNLLSSTIGAWWSLWGLRAVEWTPVGFAALMVFPTLIFLRTVILLTETSGVGGTWRDHYYLNRRLFFAVSAVSALSSIALPAAVHLDSGETFPYWAIGVGFIVAMNVTGFASAKPRVHEIIAVLSFALGLGWLIPTPG